MGSPNRGGGFQTTTGSWRNHAGNKRINLTTKSTGKVKKVDMSYLAEYIKKVEAERLNSNEVDEVKE